MLPIKFVELKVIASNGSIGKLDNCIHRVEGTVRNGCITYKNIEKRVRTGQSGWSKQYHRM